VTALEPKNSGHSDLKYLNIAGIKLEAKWYPGAARKAPTLVFLHEGLGCVGMWRDFPEQLAQLTGCPAFAYSRQGYGHSTPCALPRPLDYMHREALEVLPEVLTAAGIEDHILIGHSDGGSIALINAGGNPGAGLRGLITMAPHVFCEALSIRSIMQIKQDFTDGGLRSALAKYHHDNTDCAFWGWNDVWLDPDFLAWNIEEYLPAIRVPQLILQGEEDQYGTVAQAQAVIQLASAPTELHMLADCGHSPYKEQQLQSLELMKNFLEPLLSHIPAP
jgi:pimeloyl-ACP methyl ester carboxylesterase